MNKTDKTPITNEVPKYRKKKQSKSDNRADHRHEYSDCLLIVDSKPYKAKYCTACGKISNLYFGITESKGKFRRILDSDEVFEKYKGLPQFTVSSIKDKYVTMKN